MQFSLYGLGNVYTQYTAINHVFLNLNIYDILWYCIIFILWLSLFYIL